MIMRRALPCFASALCLVATAVGAAPVTASNVGYYLDTIGSNSIGISGGGSASGMRTTLFLANTTPTGGAGGTTATATIGPGNSPTSVGFIAGENLWARRAALDDFQRNALSATFMNGPDSTTVLTRDLFGISNMPLAPSFTLSGDPFSPLLSWTLPEGNGFDIDRVGLAFYNDDTNTEIGTRVFRSGATTSFQIRSVLPEGLNIVFDLRLFDLDDRILPGETGWGNGDILSLSRTYLAYSVPTRISEPAALSLVLIAGLAAAAARRRQTR